MSETSTKTQQKQYTEPELITPSGNKFKVLHKKLGSGGFGEVYQGYRLSDNAQVAVKYVKKAKVAEWTVINNRKIPMEIALMIKVGGHKNIAKLYDWAESKNHFILFIEKPNNCIDLFDYITHEVVLSENKARGFFKQVIESIEYCHYKGVVHRDIKDENFVYDKDSGLLKLIDFGGGTWYDEKKVFTTFDGTRVYSPPEWISENWYRLIPLTVWSLGILLFDMVQGNIPFEKDNQIMANKVNFHRYKISKECKHLILSCLQTNPNKRLTINLIKAHPWYLNSKDKSLQKYSSKKPYPIASYNSCKTQMMMNGHGHQNRINEITGLSPSPVSVHSHLNGHDYDSVKRTPPKQHSNYGFTRKSSVTSTPPSTTPSSITQMSSSDSSGDNNNDSSNSTSRNGFCLVPDQQKISTKNTQISIKSNHSSYGNNSNNGSPSIGYFSHNSNSQEILNSGRSSNSGMTTRSQHKNYLNSQSPVNGRKGSDTDVRQDDTLKLHHAHASSKSSRNPAKNSRNPHPHLMNISHGSPIQSPIISKNYTPKYDRYGNQNPNYVAHKNYGGNGMVTRSKDLFGSPRAGASDVAMGIKGMKLKNGH